MIKAINLSKTVRHVLSFDPDKGTDKETTFELGALDSRSFSLVKDKAANMVYDGGEPLVTMKATEANFELVSFGLKGWNNFMDENGNQIPFKSVRVNKSGKNMLLADPELVKLLPAEAIDELADEILKLNQLTSEEAKN